MPIPVPLPRPSICALKTAVCCRPQTDLPRLLRQPYARNQTIADRGAGLPAKVQQARETLTPSTINLPEDDIDFEAFVAGIERDLIQRSLERSGGNNGQAAHC